METRRRWDVGGFLSYGEDAAERGHEQDGFHFLWLNTRMIELVTTQRLIAYIQQEEKKKVVTAST